MLIKLEVLCLYLFFKFKIRRNGYNEVRKYLVSSNSKSYKSLDKKAEAIISVINSNIDAYEKSNICLYKSLIGYLMLNRRNYKVNIKVGIKFPPFASHAWLEHDDKTTIFGEDSDRYLTLN
ncbi:hypothetical protein J40TS1_07730 [Paenibacillus montaniterrae]|uniref:Microcin J25-processing protein McjB C-terminal domain-containing protein n=1 Tax=Paenibacillus montaniterrae TaxID=429341 RepID=A0A919YPR3_9BACL|nr:lasso peptide biosynthesis B2 protein [Paenibacillus montaniterrae]GIP15131.1 hypothetical protein J40TS1_07730 [Paenibacillus montaniterrae]